MHHERRMHILFACSMYVSFNILPGRNVSLTKLHHTSGVTNHSGVAKVHIRGFEQSIRIEPFLWRTFLTHSKSHKFDRKLTKRSAEMKRLQDICSRIWRHVNISTCISKCTLSVLNCMCVATSMCGECSDRITQNPHNPFHSSRFLLSSVVCMYAVAMKQSLRHSCQSLSHKSAFSNKVHPEASSHPFGRLFSSPFFTACSPCVYIHYYFDDWTISRSKTASSPILSCCSPLHVKVHEREISLFEICKDAVVEGRSQTTWILVCHFFCQKSLKIAHQRQKRRECPDSVC